MRPTLHSNHNGLRLLLPLLPALSTFLLLAFVLEANNRIVAEELTLRGHFRVTQNAALFAEQIARVVGRRAAELELLAPFVVPASVKTPAPLNAMQRLQDTSGSYAGIALFDISGRALLATGEARLLDRWRPTFQAGAHLLVPGVVPTTSGSTPLLAVLVVPVRSASGEPQGHLVALLTRFYFENLRQIALGELAGRHGMSMTLHSADGTTLLGPSLPALSSDFLLVQQAVLTSEADLVSDWTVTAFQPLEAAQAPALRLQQGLLLWGLTATLFIGGAGLWLSRRISRPYNELLDAVSHSKADVGPYPPGAYLQSVRAALKQLNPTEPTGQSSDPLLAGLLQDGQRLQAVIDELPSPVYLLGPDRRVTYWNRQAERVFGWTSAQAIGQPIAQLLPGKVPQHPGAGANPVEVRTQDRQGAELWCEWRLLALQDGGGQTTGQVALVRDITERVHAASALAQYQLELSELTKRLLEQEKRTSRQLAQTLHDQLGQTLGAIRLAYDSLTPLWQAAQPGRQHQRVQALGQMIARANAEVRQALIELRPPLLQEEGLAMALDNELHLRRANAEPVLLELQIDDIVVEQRWALDVEYAAFMIAREAVTNALHHAGAHLVQVHLGGDAQHLTLHVSDDGVGLPDELHAGRPGHLGLVGIRERALAIGASIEFIPTGSHGLTVVLRWPAPPSIPISDIPLEAAL